MTHTRQLVLVARACFRPALPQTIIGVSTYGGYLAWLAMHEVGMIGATAYIHLCVALATSGAWIGTSVGRVARWPGAAFNPAFRTALGIVATLVGVSAVGLNGAAAWVGGLDLGPLAHFGALALAAGLACGRTHPMLTMYLLLCLGILVPLGPLLKPGVPLPVPGEATALAAGAAIVGATALIARFAFRLSRASVASLSQSSRTRRWRTTTANPFLNRLTEPSVQRIVVTSGMLAAGCTIAHRHGGLEWRDATLIAVIGSVCTILGATGTSASLPRGPLPGVGWLFLSGIAKTRSHGARRVLWCIVADSMFAAGVFTAVTVALGPDWRLVEMMLVALAACHAYLAAACPSRWLLSSRLSVFVATPAVVAIAVAAWSLVPWSLPTAITACVLSGVAAVCLGGIGMGRIDLDPIPDTEPRS